MNITVTSAFRDSSQRQVLLWVCQLAALQKHVGPNHNVHGVAVEGDSVDDTAARIATVALQQGVPVTVVKQDLGTPRYGSVDEPGRMKALSQVLNCCFDHVPEDSDVVLHVESDLVWSPADIGSLLDLALGGNGGGGADVVAPLIFAGEVFYDIWGFRGLDGERWSPFTPYHKDVVLPPAMELTNVASVGSCLAMRASIARGIRVLNDYALVGWCEAARAAGLKIQVAPWLKVVHP